MKHPRGRTMRQAIEAQDSYELAIPGWASPFWCPGTAGIDEAVQAYQTLCPNSHPGEVQAFRVLAGSQIGCMIVEESETVIL